MNIETFKKFKPLIDEFYNSSFFNKFNFEINNDIVSFYNYETLKAQGSQTYSFKIKNNINVSCTGQNVVKKYKFQVFAENNYSLLINTKLKEQYDTIYKSFNIEQDFKNSADVIKLYNNGKALVNELFNVIKKSDKLNKIDHLKNSNKATPWLSNDINIIVDGDYSKSCASTYTALAGDIHIQLNNTTITFNELYDEIQDLNTKIQDLKNRINNI